MPYLNINDHKIFYNKTGNGEPIIFLHNGFYSTMTWDGIRDKFAQEYMVIDYDRFGYGRSDHFINIDVDIVEEGVKELEEVVDKLKLDKFYLCGHCLGGAIALLYAIKHPDKIKKIVAESVGYFSDTKLLVKSDWTFQPFKAMDRYLRKELKRMHGEEYSKEFWGIIRDYDKTYIMADDYSILDRIKKVKCPVFIMNGDRDFYFDVEHPVKAYKKIKDSRLWIIPKCGHDPHVEHKDTFIEQVLSFLKE